MKLKNNFLSESNAKHGGVCRQKNKSKTKNWINKHRPISSALKLKWFQFEKKRQQMSVQFLIIFISKRIFNLLFANRTCHILFSFHTNTHHSVHSVRHTKGILFVFNWTQSTQQHHRHNSMITKLRSKLTQTGLFSGWKSLQQKIYIFFRSLFIFSAEHFRTGARKTETLYLYPLNGV